MTVFYPFIHQTDRKKKEKFEPIPLYIELGPIPFKEEEEKKEEEKVIIIEIL